MLTNSGGHNSELYNWHNMLYNYSFIYYIFEGKVRFNIKSVKKK